MSGTVIALVERDDPADAGGRGGAVRGRAVVCSQQGEVLLELDRITLKATGPAASAEPAESTPATVAASIETVVWRKVDPAPAQASAGEGPVLVVSAHALRPPAGRYVLHLTPAQLSAGGPDALPADTVFRDVVYVAPRGLTGEAQVTQALQEVFALVRRLAARPPMPSLLIVTAAAHQVVAQDAVDPFMTALWGLGRTLQVEHPRTRVRLLDLDLDLDHDLGDPADPEDGAAAALWETLEKDRPELARRGDAWYEPSLRPQSPARPTGRARYRDGRFLITGGMGGIGLRVAEYLAEAGCAHLTLVGRTVPDRERPGNASTGWRNAATWRSWRRTSAHCARHCPTPRATTGCSTPPECCATDWHAA